MAAVLIATGVRSSGYPRMEIAGVSPGTVLNEAVALVVALRVEETLRIGVVVDLVEGASWDLSAPARHIASWRWPP